jgi:hypothetical protein
VGEGKKAFARAQGMTINILSLALADLEAGRRFYEKQGPGLGNYSSTLCFPTSIHCLYMREFTARFLDITDFCPSAFHLPSIT